MNSYPNPDVVRAGLGDKFLEAFVSSIAGAREDLEAFRAFQPGWYADYSKRFVANFIHERMWSRLVEEVHDHAEVTIINKEPIRQIHHGTRWVIRVKRHSANASIAAYPTEGSVAFWTQNTHLPGLDEVSLAMGYLWDVELGDIGGAVLSFRDGKDNPIWMVKIEGGGVASGELTFQPIIDPALPTFDLSGVLSEENAASEDR